MSENKKLLLSIGTIIIVIILGLFLLNSSSNLSQNLSQVLNNNQTQLNPLSGSYNFTLLQSPTFNFPSIAYASDLKNKTSLFNSRGEQIQTEISVSQSGKGSSVQVQKPQQFIPGKYSLIIDQNGKKIEQDFNWGVLAINTNKSVYSPGETAKLALAVLDERGKMVCDADVTLEIKNPSGQITSLNTHNGGITVNPECNQKNLTVNPDYEARYQTGLSGNYQMSLTATTSKGTYNIVDSFSVENNIDFDVERITATRVFPYSVYPVIIKITAKKDFSGQITEIVPSSFIISPLEKAIAYKSIQNQDTNQLILWNLSIKKGQSINIGYNYKAPLISPQFYLIGPLNMTSGGTKVFEEKRVWQLAIDDISYSSTIKTTPGLIAYYRLGETTGTTLTDSIGTSSGTYFNGPNLGQAGSIFRDQDTAVKFNSASSQYADVNNVPNWGAGPVTFELWYKMNTTSATDKGFLQRTDGVTADRWFFFRCGGTCTPTGAIKMGASASPIQTTNAAITDTNWHYIVAIKGTAANDWRIYVDGVNGGGTPPTFTAGNDFGIVKIGIDLANDFQDGTMDEVAIYNTALTESQILQHYNLGISTKYSYSSLILTTPGLASYWRLGETSGTTAVDSFGTNNGTYTNSPTLGFSGALAFDPDTAVDFNGSTQYVSIPDADYLSTVTNNALSVEFWTFPSGAVDGNVIVGKAASSNFEWALSRAGTTDFRLTTYQLGGATYDSTSSQGPNWPDNAWYHVVATMKAGDNKLYVNGNLYAIGDDGYTGSTGNGTSPVNIARRGDNSLYYNGAVDELAIYDTILTPDQIKAHYQAGINGLHTTFQGVKLQGIQVSN